MVFRSAFFIFLTFFISSVYGICELKKEVVSLSGPITMLLEELNLLKDKNLKAISKFHPIKKETKAVLIAGGLFLSKRKLTHFKKVIFFYDQSRELSQILKKAKIGSPIEVKTRSLNPFSTVESNLISLEPFLIGCQQKIEEVKNKIKVIEKGISLPPEFIHSIFYLGRLRDKKPNIVIGKDGFILSLLTIQGFKTYPTDLAYVPWSKKIVDQLEDYTHIGLNDFLEDDLLMKRRSTKLVNLFFRGIFIPGIRQVYFLDALAKVKQNR